MKILGKLTSAADEPRCCIKMQAGALSHVALAGKPISIVGEKTLTSSGHTVALLERLDTVRNFKPKELAQIGANQVARRLATENSRGRELPSVIGLERFREGIEIADGRGNKRVPVVFAKRYIPGQ